MRNVPGFASIVTSAFFSTWKYRRINAMIFVIRDSSNRDGVPPPTKDTAHPVVCNDWRIHLDLLTQAINIAKHRSIAFPIKRQEITVFAFYDAKRYMNI